MSIYQNLYDLIVQYVYNNATLDQFQELVTTFYATTLTFLMISLPFIVIFWVVRMVFWR